MSASHVRMIGYVCDPMDRNAKIFAGKLRAAADDIRADAEGRTCGGCVHHREGWCDERTNLDGDPLAVLRPDAVACGAWAPVKAIV